MKKNLDPSSVSKRVQSVERALLILKCFNNQGDSLTLASLAQRSELYKSTILRLVTSLDVMASSGGPLTQDIFLAPSCVGWEPWRSVNLEAN